jgi:hypothetical protein
MSTSVICRAQLPTYKQSLFGSPDVLAEYGGVSYSNEKRKLGI